MDTPILSRSGRIAQLNDHLRRTFSGGKVVMTATVDSLDPATKAEVLSAVRAFDKFDGDNDPHDEHDMAFFEVKSERYFFKVDYYDKSIEFGSEDPCDTVQTTRVLTIGEASDY
jgi:hypothetical protein